MKRSIFGFSCPLIKRKMFSANLIIEKKATVRVDRNRRQRRNEKKEPLGGPFSVCAQRINSSTSAWQRAVKAWTPRRARRRRSRGLNDSFSFLSGTNWYENQVSVHVTDRTLSLAHSLTLLLQLPKTREGGGDYANAEDIRGRRAIFRLACYQVRSLWIYMCGARSDNSWHDEGKKKKERSFQVGALSGNQIDSSNSRKKRRRRRRAQAGWMHSIEAKNTSERAKKGNFNGEKKNWIPTSRISPDVVPGRDRLSDPSSPPYRSAIG